MTDVLIIGMGDLGYPLARTIASLDGINVFATRQNKTKGFDCLTSTATCGYDNRIFVKKADVIISAVRPSDLGVVLAEIRPYLQEDKLFISTAACKKIALIKSILGESANVLRAMPNVAISSKESMTFLSYDEHLPKKYSEYAVNLFSQMGKTQVIPDEKMNIAPVCGASMPAIMSYLQKIIAGFPNSSQEEYDRCLLFVRDVIIEIAHKYYGLPNSEVVIDQVLLGIEYLTSVEGKTLDEIMKRVATKGGCTEQILRGMSEAEGYYTGNNSLELVVDMLHYSIGMGIRKLENM